MDFIAHSHPSPRAPELWPGPLFGAALPDARGTRLRVNRDGAVEFVRRGGRPRLICAPHTITRVTWLAEVPLPRLYRPSAGRGVLGLWADERLVAAINLQSVGSPWSKYVVESGGDNELWRHTSGLEAFAAALGLRVEAADGPDARRLGLWGPARAISLAQSSLLPTWIRNLLALASVLLSYWSLTAAEDGYSTWALPLAVLAVGLVVVPLWWVRRQVISILSEPLDPAGRAVVEADPPDPEGLSTFRGSLQVGGRTIVLVGAGGEWWLPGPELGGITRARVHPDQRVSLLQGDHTVVVLGTGNPRPDDNTGPLLHALNAFGVSIEGTPPLSDDGALEFGDISALRVHDGGYVSFMQGDRTIAVADDDLLSGRRRKVLLRLARLMRIPVEQTTDSVEPGPWFDDSDLPDPRAATVHAFDMSSASLNLEQAGTDSLTESSLTLVTMILLPIAALWTAAEGEPVVGIGAGIAWLALLVLQLQGRRRHGRLLKTRRGW